MSLPAQKLHLSVEEYLKLEESSTLRHEYVGGSVFSTADSTEAHNAIVMNLALLLGPRVRGSGCRVFASDMKVRAEAINSFYYPDLMVTCELFSAKSVYKTSPSLIGHTALKSNQNIPGASLS